MPRKRKTFDEIQIQKALLDVRNGVSKKAAAKLYNIPRSTIQFRLGPQFSKVRPGPATVLTEDEEKRIVEWIKVSQKKGFPKRKEDVLHAVQEFLTENKRPHSFGAENIPGKGWFQSFLKRNPTLTFRVTDPVTAASSTVAASDLYSWFDGIERFLADNNYLDILDDPTRIFNGDETNFLLCPKTKTVLAAKGSRNVYEIDKGLAKVNLTVMFTFSATGEVVPPMVIYPYKRVPEEIRKTFPKGWGMGISDNGWMTRELFYEYVSKVLHPYLVQLGTKFPIIYYVDGHATHLTLSVSELCVRLQIILVALYPNATRILQPADVAAFKPIKASWNNKVLEWRRNNPMDFLTKDKFAPLLYEVVASTISAETIQKGFRACGLFPFNKLEINLTKCLGRSSKNSNIELNPTIQISAIETFCSTVGEKRLQIFKKIENGEIHLSNFNEDFHVLYDLYKKLKCITQTNQSFSDQSTQTDVENEIININSINEFLIISNHEDTLNQGEIINLLDVVPVSENEPTVAILQGSSFNKPDDVTEPIESFLNWPETPFRKGTKQIKTKKPFVITSPLWREHEKIKKEQKKQLELDKEIRKTNRMKNKELKNSMKMTKKIKRPRNPKLTNTLKEKVQTSTVPSSQTSLSTENSSAMVQDIGNGVNFDSTMAESLSSPVDGGTKIIEPPTDNHIRNLFPSEFVSDIGDNSPARGVMCYKCTFAFSKTLNSENFGIKCNKCQREFHIKCLINLKCTYLPIFVCNGCKIGI